VTEIGGSVLETEPALAVRRAAADASVSLEIVGRELIPKVVVDASVRASGALWMSMGSPAPWSPKIPSRFGRMLSISSLIELPAGRYESGTLKKRGYPASAAREVPGLAERAERAESAEPAGATGTAEAAGTAEAREASDASDGWSGCPGCHNRSGWSGL